MSRMPARKSPLPPSIHAKCVKTAAVTKYGLPYTLICSQSKGHSGNCRDVYNDVWFEPDNPR
jgi:hypothetical protein